MFLGIDHGECVLARDDSKMFETLTGDLHDDLRNLDFHAGGFFRAHDIDKDFFNG